MNNILHIDEKFKGLIRLAKDSYLFIGNIITNDSLVITLNGSLTVIGDILIGGGIKSLYSIIAHGKITTKNDISVEHGGLEASRSIISGGNIITKSDINAGESISADKDIMAGKICAGHNISSYGTVISHSDIKAGYFIIVYGNILANGCIFADETIIVDGSITTESIIAGAPIVTNSYIDVRNNIFAGASANIKNYKSDNIITCAEFRNGKIAYGKLVIK